MRLSKTILFYFLMLCTGCKSQIAASRIEVVRPSVEQEATSIWRTINDISFLENQGYTVHLPKDPLIDSLISKSKKRVFGNEDFSAIRALVETEVFEPKHYEQAILKVENQIELINTLINDIDTNKKHWDWNFNIFEKYKIVFTLYGTGGSYNPDDGTITIWTDKEGKFMNYENPANTIIHEITHIGMEYAMVQEYNLAHGMKERLVDTFVYLMFQEELPEYNIQNMGDKRIDRYLKNKKDINSLDSIVRHTAKK